MNHEDFSNCQSKNSIPIFPLLELMDSLNLKRSPLFDKHSKYLIFLENNLEKIKECTLGIPALDFVLSNADKVEGLWMEFGVWKGTTISLMAKSVPETKIVYGFDSFEGLPSDWKFGFEVFNFFPNNVVLVPGWFSDTLMKFIASLEANAKVSLLHIDCDIYESTSFVLQCCGPLLVAGSIIVFDELINYAGFERHEMLAWFETVVLFGLEFEWIGLEHIGSQKVALKVVRNANTEVDYQFSQTIHS
eukprot:Awhi_evm1s12646